MKIAVLMGGTSAEREVSLATGEGIARSLRQSGHDVVPIDAADGRLIELESEQVTGAGIGRQPPAHSELRRPPAGSLARRLEELLGRGRVDVAFVALHGGAGEDGRVQALLDLIGIPYTGSGPLGSALAMDKLVAKELFAAGGVPTPPWLVGPLDARQAERALGGFPLVVKPAREGSTVGVSVVRTAADFGAALERAAGFGGPPLIEKFIPGGELAVGVLGDAALPVVEIRPSHDIYDYECKYTKGMSQYEVPAPIDAEITEAVQALAVRAHRILRLSAYSRIDFRLDENGEPWCLEANSLPGMTPTSLLPKAAAAARIPFGELCERIVRLALERAAAGGTGPDGAG